MAKDTSSGDWCEGWIDLCDAQLQPLDRSYFDAAIPTRFASLPPGGYRVEWRGARGGAVLQSEDVHLGDGEWRRVEFHVQSTRVHGSVLVGGRPRPGVAVQLQEDPVQGISICWHADTSDASGAYSIQGVPAGKYRVDVEGWGQAEWLVDGDRAELRLDFESEEKPRTGKVVDRATGLPIAGAHVRAIPHVELPSAWLRFGDLLPSCVTDATGCFQLPPLPTHSLDAILAEADGYAPSSYGVDRCRDTMIWGPPTIAIDRGGEVCVHVRDEDGPTYARVRARVLRGPERPRLSAPVETWTKNGRAILTGLPPGEYEVIAFSRGDGPYTQVASARLTVPNVPGRQDLDLRLGVSGTLLVSVSDEVGAPVGASEFHFREASRGEVDPASYSDFPRLAPTEDEDRSQGALFTWLGLPPGKYAVEVVRGFQRTTIDADIESMQDTRLHVVLPSR